MDDKNKTIISIIDEIDEQTYKDVVNSTRELQDGAEVILEISSYGGEILRAFAIIDLLKRFKTKADIIGFACSAAAIIALSCDECSMSENSSMLLHSAWVVSADGKEPDPGIKRCNDLQLEIIHKRCPEFDADLINKDTWLSAEECLALHLADNIYILDNIDYTATCKKYAAKLSYLNSIKGDTIMDESVKEVVEQVQEEVKEDKAPVTEENEVKEDNHDLLEVVEKLSEEINALKARVVALEEVKEEVKEKEIEAECGDKDNEQERINNIYKNIVAPQACVSIGAPKAVAKVTHEVDYKKFANFIKG